MQVQTSRVQMDSREKISIFDSFLPEITLGSGTSSLRTLEKSSNFKYKIISVSLEKFSMQ
jgi:hypothetical protein